MAGHSGRRERPPIELFAVGLVAAPPAKVFAFLADLRNHWVLTGRRVRLVSLEADGTGAVIEVRGPLGLRCRAETTVVRLRSPREIDGVARGARSTTAAVRWRLERGRHGSTKVTLSAVWSDVAAVDRLLLSLGGARSMTRLLEGALDRLGAHFADKEAAGGRRAGAPGRAKRVFSRRWPTTPDTKGRPASSARCSRR